METIKIQLASGQVIWQFVFLQDTALPGQVLRVWMPEDRGQRWFTFVNSVRECP